MPSALNPKALARGTLGVAGGRTGSYPRVLHRLEEERPQGGVKWICCGISWRPIFSLPPGKLADFKRCAKCFAHGALERPTATGHAICIRPGCTAVAYGEFLAGLSFCEPHLRATRREATKMARRKGLADAQRQQLGEAYGWTCVYCRRRGTPEHDPDGRFWHADHEDAWCETWNNSPQALVLACTRCNTRKQDRRWQPSSQPIESLAGEQLTIWG